MVRKKIEITIGTIGVIGMLMVVGGSDSNNQMHLTAYLIFFISLFLVGVGFVFPKYRGKKKS